MIKFPSQVEVSTQNHVKNCQVIETSRYYNGESSNWRLDWQYQIGTSYADIVKKVTPSQIKTVKLFAKNSQLLQKEAYSQKTDQNANKLNISKGNVVKTTPSGKIVQNSPLKTHNQSQVNSKCTHIHVKRIPVQGNSPPCTYESNNRFAPLTQTGSEHNVQCIFIANKKHNDRCDTLTDVNESDNICEPSKVNMLNCIASANPCRNEMGSEIFHKYTWAGS